MYYRTRLCWITNISKAKKYKTSGYDINKKRKFELKKGIDVFGEFKKNNFIVSKQIK